MLEEAELGMCGVALTWISCSVALTKSRSCRGSAQNGPPMRKPEPVSGHFSGTAGPLPGECFTASPFTSC